MDDRIPLVIGMPERPGDVALRVVSAHVIGCACCGGRGGVARELSRLFQARMRGEVAWFDRVVAPSMLAEEVRTVLVTDAFVAARFRSA